MSYKKQIFKLHDLKKFLTEDNSCISLTPTVRLLALPPFFLNDMKSGILYLLNNMLKKYDRSLEGIVIGYQNIKVLMDENTGIIPIGTSETVVNISVEFYIFQPRIGSCLKGVVNKISNNHIGCLVHQYFNATILKPDDVDYEDWLCKDVNVDDKITFRVKDLDFTGLLPYIEGVIDDETLLHKNYNSDTLMVKSASKSSQKEILLSEYFLENKSTLDEQSDEDFSESKKTKNKNEKVNKSEGDLNINLEGIDSFTNLKKKKKKKKHKEEEKLPVTMDCNYSEKSNYLNDEEVTSSTSVFNQTDDSSSIKKKKKKKKKKSEDIDRDGQDSAAAAAVVENAKVSPSETNQTFLEKLVAIEDENSCDFVKPFKTRKEKKKRNEEEEPPHAFNKISQCLSPSKMEDNVLYSTLLDPAQSDKMRISFCSPIPLGTPLGRKKGEMNSAKDSDSKTQINNLDNESAKKEKKKKEKKRKREERESDDHPPSKKPKTSLFEKEDKKSEVTDDDDGDALGLRILTEQLYNEQLGKMKKAINASEEGNCKEEKKKRKKDKKHKKENTLSSVLSRNTEILSNDGIGKKFESQSSKLETPRAEELNAIVEQFFQSNNEANIKVSKGKESFKEKTRENPLEVNRIPKDQSKCVNKEKKKSDVQSMLDELVEKEIKKVKNKLKSSKSDSVGVVGEGKEVNRREEDARNGSHLLLYEKLLKDAKSSIEPGRNLPPHPFPVKESKKNKNVKDSDLSDLSVCSLKKKNSGKNKKRKKEKAEIIYYQTPVKYRNGSMYDTSFAEVATPEKINFDKSLFTDSEQSHASPVKKAEDHGIKGKSGNSLVQNMLTEFFAEERRKKLQSESDKESLKSLKKREKKKVKSNEKSQSASDKKESLCEKLLKEARSLMYSKEESPPKKNKK